MTTRGTAMLTSEVLNLAADLIETRGWVGIDRDPDDTDVWGWRSATAPICLEGGIYAAMGRPEGWASDDINACPAAAAVRAYLGDDVMMECWAGLGGGWGAQLWPWNDEPGRTAEEVIATLRATALIEAAREEQDAAEATYAENLAVAS